jgi:hypothetical protein
VRSGTKELAIELENRGYDWIKEEVAAWMHHNSFFIKNYYD